MKRWIQRFAVAFGIATFVALFLRLAVVENFRITSESMSPALQPGDLVLVSKYHFNLHLPFSTYEVARFRDPRRGEVVAFSLPDRGMETFVKRVVAIGGDKVALKGGILVVNGVPARYLVPPAASPDTVFEVVDGVRYPIRRADLRMEKDYGPVDVPTGHFFALGDNRAESNDSRTWGPIPYSCLQGKVEVVWLSWDPLRGFHKDRTGTWVNVI
jgi:signal peptidase I